ATLPVKPQVVRRVGGLMHGELGARRHAQAVSDPTPRHQQLLVDGADAHLAAAVTNDRKSRAVALGRRDWKPDANGARDSRAVDSRAEQEHIGVQRVASVESGGFHLAATRSELHGAPAE